MTLTACPFCGNASSSLRVVSSYDDNDGDTSNEEYFAVACDATSYGEFKAGGCGAQSGFHPSKEEAIEVWQARAALSQPQREINVRRIEQLERQLAEAKQDAIKGLTIQIKDGGTWLCFKASNGNSASVRASGIRGGPIVTAAIAQWSEDRVQEAAPAMQAKGQS